MFLSSRHSLKRRILLPLLAVLIAALGLIALWQAGNFRTELNNRLKERSEHIASVIHFVGGSTSKVSELQHLVSALAGEPEVKTIVVLGGEPARVVASSRMALIGELPHELVDPEIRNKLEKAMEIAAPGFHFNNAGGDFDYYLPVSVTASGPGGNVLQRGLVLVSLDTRLLRSEISRAMRKALAGYLGAILLIAVCGWFLLERYLFKPLMGIGQAITAFDGGNRRPPINAAHYSGELAQLAVAWNGLVERLWQENRVRTAAEEALQRAQWFQSLSNAIPQHVWTAEPDGALDFFNQRLLEFHERTFEQMIGWGWEEVIHPDDLARCGASWQHSLATGDPYEIEFRLKGADGSYLWHLSRALPLHDSEGKIIKWFGTNTDLSSRIRSEESVRLLSAAVEQSEESIIITDAQLDLPGPSIVFVNRAFTEMTGYSAAETLGVTPRILQGPNTDRSVMRRLRETMARGEVFEGEATNYRKDGTHFQMEWQITPIRTADGTITHYVAIQRDITTRKDAEAERAELNRRLVDASRQAGMAEVATNVLHNVGNVLNSVNISCYVISDKLRKSRIPTVMKTADLLKQHAADLAQFFTTNPAGRKLPEFLGKLAARLAEEQTAISNELESLSVNIDHIKQIVSMQQNHAGAFGAGEIIIVTDLVEESLRIKASVLTRHGIRVVREYGEVSAIFVERHKILQILVNLISNAKSSCEAFSPAEKQITVRVTEADGFIRISVIDNGEGIPKENFTRIFAYGFTTRKNGHGFGLHGSVLAAQEAGGNLTVYSEGVGKGAMFTLELPVATSLAPLKLCQ